MLTIQNSLRDVADVSSKTLELMIAMNTFLWEDNYYENGELVSDKIKHLAAQVPPDHAKTIMKAAKFVQKLRKAPLWIAISLLEQGSITGEELAEIITRPDDITELISMYWHNKKRPLKHQLKKAINIAFNKFDSYQLSKYANHKSDVKLRDALKLTHPKPIDEEHSIIFKKIIEGTVKAPLTWEVLLSKGANKKEAFEKLLIEDSLGDLAFLRNLRLMNNCFVSSHLIEESIKKRAWTWIMPYQFIIASQYATPQQRVLLEEAMLRSTQSFEKIEGRLAILVDASGSMNDKLSKCGDVTRFDVACSVAILFKEIGSDVDIYTFNDRVAKVDSSARGFAIRSALGLASGGTFLGKALRELSPHRYDMIIIITDEQATDHVNFDKIDTRFIVIVNIASYTKGLRYGSRVAKVYGWSDNLISFIKQQFEIHCIPNVLEEDNNICQR